MKISKLTQIQRDHLAWRLDQKTSCGILTAYRIALMKLGDMEVCEAFEKYGGVSRRSAKIHAAKTAKFEINK